jgi:hypothetical protein
MSLHKGNNSSVAACDLTIAWRETVPLGTLWHAKVTSRGLRFTAKILLLFIPEKKQGYCGTNIEIPVKNRQLERKIQLRNPEDSGRNMQPRGAWWGGQVWWICSYWLLLSQQVGCLFLDSGCANTLQQRTAQVVGLLIGSGSGTILAS